MAERLQNGVRTVQNTEGRAISAVCDCRLQLSTAAIVFGAGVCVAVGSVSLWVPCGVVLPGLGGPQAASEMVG